MKGLEKGPSSARSGSAIDPRYKGVASEAIAKAPPGWAAFLMACTPLPLLDTFQDSQQQVSQPDARSPEHQGKTPVPPGNPIG